MAKKPSQAQQYNAGQEDHGPICSGCGTGSFPRGFCVNLGLCWTCQNPRTPAEFAQMAADTAARAASFERVPVALAA